MRLWDTTVSVTCSTLLALAGCTTGGGSSSNSNSNSNANVNANSNTSVNDNAATGELGESEAAAVEQAMDDLEAVVTALASATVVTDPPEGDAAFGGCPLVSATRVGDTVELTLDYGDGCTTNGAAEATLSGSVTGTVDLATRSVTLTYEEFSIDGQSVDGTLSFVRTADPSDGDSFEVSVALSISELGTIEGALTVTYDTASSVIIVDSGELSVTDPDGGSLEIVVDGLVFDPVGNGNLVPEAGSITITAPNDDPPPQTLTITVTFDAQSPVDGTVSVRVGSAPPVEYQLLDV